MTDKRTGKKAKRPVPPKAVPGADATPERVIGDTARRSTGKSSK